MQQIGLWHVTELGPRKLRMGSIELEKHLEDWIEKDPSLLQTGLVIVGRQVGVESGRLDLLALDLQGRWTVIEIKSGMVHRDTIAQAMDYASTIATMPYAVLSQKADTYLANRFPKGGKTLKSLLEERPVTAEEENRDVQIYLVGTGRAPGLERIVDYSKRHGLPINIVLFEVYEISDGQQILVRELASTETNIQNNQEKQGTSNSSLEGICSIADKAGVGKDFRRILNAAQKYDLYPRVFRHAVMYTPASNRTRMLFTVKATPTRGDDKLQVYVWPQVFSEFYPVSPEKATIELGTNIGWRKMTSKDVGNFIEGLDNIFHEVGFS